MISISALNAELANLTNSYNNIIQNEIIPYKGKLLDIVNSCIESGILNIIGNNSQNEFVGLLKVYQRGFPNLNGLTKFSTLTDQILGLSANIEENNNFLLFNETADCRANFDKLINVILKLLENIQYLRSCLSLLRDNVPSNTFDGVLTYGSFENANQVPAIWQINLKKLINFLGGGIGVTGFLEILTVSEKINLMWLQFLMY